MKLIQRSIPVLLILAASCSNAPDATKDAKNANADRLDSLKTVEQPGDSAAAVISKDDAAFLVNATAGGMLEVELGQLATENSANPRIRKFGAMMVEQHGAGGKELQAIAGTRNLV